MIFAGLSPGFCPRCGTQSETLFGGFCLNCLLAEGKLFFVPKKIDAELCSKCKKVKLREKWVPFSDAPALSLVEAASKVSGLEGGKILLRELDVQEKFATSYVLVEGVFEGEKISVPNEVEIKFLRTVCPACSRVSGSYFEAIIQGRFEPKTPEKDIKAKFDELKKFIDDFSEKDPLSKIVKTGFSKNGFDAWIGSKKASKKACGFFESQLKAPVVVSFKLHGWDLSKNRPMKRLTFSLRF